MAEIIVTATTDSAEWETGVNHLADIIRQYTLDASIDAAGTVGRLAAGLLHEREHGPLSFSPSPAGSPPATVSGDLAASITVVPSGDTSAMVGPTTAYGRIQELGGDMYGHPYMKFTKLMDYYSSSYRYYVTFKKEHVRLEARPYLAPATETAVHSGKVRDIYAQWWADAIEAGAG